MVLQHQYGRILSQLRIMYTVGYSLSLGALLLALGILITFRYNMYKYTFINVKEVMNKEEGGSGNQEERKEGREGDEGKR